MLDLQNPFYRPLWLRLAITGICLGWGLFELSNGATAWAMLFGGLGLYCAYQFFVVFNPRDPDDKD